MFVLDQLSTSQLGDEIAYQEVRENVARTLQSNPDQVRTAMLVDGQSAYALVMQMIMNRCGLDLSSGHDHTYRGVLSLIGKSKRSIFHHAQNLLLEKGLIEQEDVEFGRKKLNEEIKNAG